ncbi:DNRLRE domain-containing protein [Micromonospora sp. NPDC004704]
MPRRSDEDAIRFAETEGVTFDDLEMDDYSAPEGLTQEDRDAASNPNAPPGEDPVPPDPTPTGPNPTPTTPTPTPSEPTPPPTGPPGKDQTLELPLVAGVATTNWGFEEQGEPLLVAGSYDWGDGTHDLSRTYLRFDTTALAGRTVRSATLRLNQVFAWCDTDTIDIRVFPVTGSWAPETLAWNRQPATGATGVAADATPDCEGVGTMSWPVTATAQMWATGTANHGLALRTVPEAGEGQHERYFDSAVPWEGEPVPPVLEVTLAGTGALTTGSRVPGDGGRAVDAAAPSPTSPGQITLAECDGTSATTKAYASKGWIKNQYNACHKQTGLFESWVRNRGGVWVQVGAVSFRITQLVTTFRGVRDSSHLAARDTKLKWRLDDFRTVWGTPPPAVMPVSLLLLRTRGAGSPDPCQLTSGTDRVTKTYAQWTAGVTVDHTLRSPTPVGVGRHYTANCDINAGIEFVYDRVKFTAFGTHKAIRCDSSPNISVYNGGCVIRNGVSTFKLNKNDLKVQHSAEHIDTAQQTPNLTEPLPPAGQRKHIPGSRESNDPLHRLTGGGIKNNRDLAIAACNRIWGTNRDSCDEYPFASTKEGALTGPLSYSVDEIPLKDNCASGSRLGWFYQKHRILPGDPFFVQIVGQPVDPDDPNPSEPPDEPGDTYCDQQ